MGKLQLSNFAGRSCAWEGALLNCLFVYLGVVLFPPGQALPLCSEMTGLGSKTRCLWRHSYVFLHTTILRRPRKKKCYDKLGQFHRNQSLTKLSSLGLRTSVQWTLLVQQPNCHRCLPSFVFITQLLSAWYLQPSEHGLQSLLWGSGWIWVESYLHLAFFLVLLCFPLSLKGCSSKHFNDKSLTASSLT